MIVAVVMNNDSRTTRWLHHLSVPMQLVRLELRFTILSMVDKIKRATGGRNSVIDHLRFDNVDVHQIFSHPNLISLRNYMARQPVASRMYTVEEKALMDLEGFFDHNHSPHATFVSCSWGSFSTVEIKSTLSYLAEKAWRVRIDVIPTISGVSTPFLPTSAAGSGATGVGMHSGGTMSSSTRR